MASTVLHLTTDLTIYHAAGLKDQLLTALGSCDRLEVNLAQVAEIDTAGLQLLILLKREANAASKELALVAHSQSVQKTVDFTQLAGFFSDPMVLSAEPA